MLTLRRYRVFLIVAVLAVATLYYLAGSSGEYVQDVLDVTRKISYEQAFGGGTGSGGHDRFPKPMQNPDIPVTPKKVTEEDSPEQVPQAEPPPPRAKGENVANPFIDATLPTRPNLNLEEDKENKNTAPKVVDKTKKPSKKGKERYPVSSADLIKLPTGEPKPLPKIQFAFEPETPSEKADRIKKQNIVLKSFEHAWGGYKKYAMGCDELKPLSKQCGNQTQFMGWGATLVDSLDTLWIMGMEDEFANAVKQVEKINFKTSTSEKVPLFETVIRYLGGLLSAYDLSEKKYPVLLEKATELADVLMGAFDTPNRMPIPYYYLAGTDIPEFQLSSRHTVLAELGSLSMEFTHLAQLTKKDKYYDAVARITNALETWQSETRMPGLWPLRLDSSGCKLNPNGAKSKAKNVVSNDKSNSFVNYDPASDQVPKDATSNDKPVNVPTGDKIAAASEEDKVLAIEKPPIETAENIDKLDTTKIYTKRQSVDMPLLQERAATKPESGCDPQGLRHESNPPDGKIVFGIGGLADSVYEYMPKMHALLGGTSKQYQDMYQYAMKAIRDGLLFRPMIPDEKRSILFASRQEFDAKRKDSKTTIWEGTHLTCFAGGMVGLASRMFDNPKDLDIAKRLTDGCVWAYESTPAGVMPETFNVMPCEQQSSCPWDEKRWHQFLDLGMQERLDAADAYNKHQETLYGKGAASSPDSEIVLGNDKKQTSKSSDDESSPSEDLSQVLGRMKSKPKTPEEKSVKGDISNDEEPTKPKDTIDRTAAATENEVEDKGATIVKGGIKKEYVQRRSPIGDSDDSDALTKSDALGKEEKPTKASSHAFEDDSEDSAPTKLTFTPKKALSHEKFIQATLQESRFPDGYTSIFDRSYKLRPEAIESVFIMWRLTGEQYWREKGWQMFQAIQAATHTEAGNAAVMDVTSVLGQKKDSMESFWLAETLKYFYLLFSEPDLISLDEYVLNTEAHPFKLPK